MSKKTTLHLNHVYYKIAMIWGNQECPKDTSISKQWNSTIKVLEMRKGEKSYTNTYHFVLAPLASTLHEPSTHLQGL